MIEKRYFLTWDFQIVRHNKVTDTLYCSKLSSDIPDDVLAVSLDVASEDNDIFVDNNFIVQGEETKEYYLDNIIVKFNTDTRAWNLKDKNKQYLCYDSKKLSFSREYPSLWEGFLLFSKEEIEKFLHLLKHKWILPQSETLVEGKDFKCIDVFKIQVGDFDVDMRYQFLRFWNKYNATLYFDGWKRETIYLYHPGIYITAYKSEAVLQQCKLCIISLREFAQFSGDIIVMTDKDMDYFHKLFDGDEKYTKNLIIHNLYPKDFLSFVCSKYEIKGKSTFQNYQPLLYLDPDIIFDKPIEPMLIRATGTGKICSPAEEFHPIQTHLAVGASLFSMDGIDGRFTPGINGGTILFPNVEDPVVERFIDEMRHLVANIGYKFGHAFNGWADQEVYNYLAVKTGLVNSSVLSSFTTYQGPAFDRRLGLVHFWGFSSDEKVERMKSYLKTLGVAL